MAYSPWGRKSWAHDLVTPPPPPVESLQRPLRAEPNTVAAGGEPCLGSREKSEGLEAA